MLPQEAAVGARHAGQCEDRMSEIAELWERLETWANANAPKMLEDLNPGATDEQVHDIVSWERL